MNVWVTHESPTTISCALPEGKGNFDICSGLDYLKETLFMQQPGILDELQTYFPGDYYNDARHHRIYKYRRDSQISPSFILKNLAC